MKRLIKNKKKSRVRITISLIAVSLVIAGIAIAIVTIQQFQEGAEKNQDEQLERTISAIDYNIIDSINRFSVQAGIFVNSDRFIDAVDEWKTSGNTRMLKSRIESAAPGTMRVFENMFIKDEVNQKGFSLDGKGYNIEEKLTENVFRSTDETGKESLAVRYEVRGDVTCYAIMSVESIFKNVLQRVNAEDRNVLLLGSVSETIYHLEGDKIGHVELGKYKRLNNGKAKEAKILASCEQNNKASGQTYERERTDSGDVITIRIVAEPSEAVDNQIFAISASADYHVIDSLLSKTVGRVIGSFILVLLGIMATLLILMQSSRERRQVDMEIENLKEKNRQMEELNQKTQELAHHQRLEAIGTMTSGIAHEFNNLLTPIMGYSMMTLEKLPQDDEKIYDDVLEIYNASVKAKDIISRLSEMSRKNTELVFKKINPDELVNRVIHVTTPSLPKHVDIIRDLNCANYHINGNEVQLSQLLLNLIINAFQELKESGGEVRIQTKREGENIVFSVKDDGEGISETFKEKIFEPFFTTKETGAGTGLGLAIAMQAAEDHGGRIELISEPDEGAEFRVYIPEAKE